MVPTPNKRNTGSLTRNLVVNLVPIRLEVRRTPFKELSRIPTITTFVVPVETYRCHRFPAPAKSQLHAAFYLYLPVPVL